MPTVNNIQPSEPRVQAGKSSQARGGEPFSDLLESAAHTRRADARDRPSRSKPSMPPSRQDARKEALPRDESAGSKPSAPTVSAPKRREDSNPPIGADDANEQPVEVVAEIESSEPDDGVQILIESIGDTAIDADEPAVEITAKDGAIAEFDVSPQSAPAPVPQVADGEAEVAEEAPELAATPPGVGQSEPAAETVPMTAGIAPNLASEDHTASPSATASGTAPPPVSAPASAPPAAPQQSASEAADTIPAPVQQARGAVPLPDQPQAQQPSPANSAATAPGGDASSPFEGDADAQLPQRQNDGQPTQAKAQEVKSAPQIEVAKPATPAVDPAAPKTQPVILPEPVRALAASFNPPGLQVANMNDRKPLPLNAAAIAVEIVSRLRDGMRRFDIRLDPPELGRIDVRLEVDRGGNVKTKLTLDRPETLDLMQRDARGLERALQQAGLKTDAGGLEFSLRSHADNGPEQGHSGRSEHPSDALVPDDGERIETVIEGYRAAAFARGGVDIRI